MFDRRRLMVAMLGVMLTHIVEVYLFAVAMYVVEIYTEGRQLIAGSAIDADGDMFADAIYLSFTTFTSLGYGDIVPIGEMRILAAIEVLTGLLTIAWSASFIYMEMTHLWNDEPDEHGPDKGS